jgi:hypothetical protein
MGSLPDIILKVLALPFRLVLLRRTLGPSSDRRYHGEDGKLFSEMISDEHYEKVKSLVRFI